MEQRHHPALRRAVACAGAVVLGLATLAATQGEAGSADPVAALTEGNRHFRNGQLEAAVEAYRRGYSPDAPHPTLLYNLGTALHHLDRLPEAILWYRRAGGSEDPWLEENLWLARRSLGSQVMPPGGPVGWLTRHTGPLRIGGVALAWAALLLLIAAPRLPRTAAAVAGVLALLLYGTAAGVERWGPREAVVLESCSSPAGEIPPGTETWVQPLDDGWRIAGSRATCPPDAVALVFPD
jgi:tetratricopeptide (TPR) repeat protein